MPSCYAQAHKMRGPNFAARKHDAPRNELATCP
eukprot:CAMPEP_0170335632 /NCGR_PEP_ID=MMETSP0116_2-20130129/68857_1 /TAXON_ID=400756 /ORGANISM="Durinskia baltica, Strain CSIRO CS-38" /LENGTH=32 /DNA_ID= /DNA_START= /DNA_END= /DNA_ORIENTATION=